LHKEDVLTLCDSVAEWIRHIHQQADYGFKFMYGHEPKGKEDSFRLYENEVVLSDNSIYANLNGHRTVYLTFNVLSLLVTSNPEFCEITEKYMKGLIRKSTLISSVSDKERNRFFNGLLKKVSDLKERIVTGNI
jgi:hypothetical protein